MKTLNKVCQFLAIALSLTSLVLFFLKFATITLAGGESVTLIGAALGFGTETKVSGTVYDMARSADILFCFWLSVIGVLLSAFAFRSKTVRYFAPAVGLGAGIYMLVIALSDAVYYVDGRPLTNNVGVTSIKYAKLFGGISTVLVVAICLLLFAIAAAAYLFIDDYLEVKASKGAKKTIFRRVISFFKDYKSEVKKIVWPNLREVTKNTAIVLAMCLIIGAFIWLLDFGLGRLLELILGA